MQNAVEILNRLEEAVSAVRQQLMTELHGVAKEQLFVGMSRETISQIPAASKILPATQSVNTKQSSEAVAGNGASVGDQTH